VNRRVAGLTVIGVALALLLGMLAVPMLIIGGTTMLFAGGGGGGCTPGSSGSVAQPGVSAAAANSIPADYLKWYRHVGAQFNVPWTVLAGIGKVESDHGRTTLPGVHSGANAFGAAGPMQIGISGAAGNTWGGAPVHPASQVVNGVATNEDGGPTASVYDPADAIAGAAKYLLAHGAQNSIPAAIFAYNHLDSYVQAVLGWASTYAGGGFTVSAVSPDSSATAGSGAGSSCTGTGTLDALVTPNAAVATAIQFAHQQIGKPYLWGGTGPDAFDCSGLVMMAYRAAGINIDRTSQQQWASEQKISPAQVQPGDLVFFAGSDGTPTAPGHVGLVIGKGKMIEAYATGFPVRISTFGTATSAPGLAKIVGFTRPWAHAGVALSAKAAAGAPGAPGAPGG
jgi:cell wall-associated NlpC family hydrolase